MIDDVKNGCDLTSLCIAVGSVTMNLPTILMILSGVWTLIRIGEWSVGKVRAIAAYYRARRL